MTAKRLKWAHLHPPMPSAVGRKHPDASLEVVVGDTPVAAAFEGGRVVDHAR